jgi:hypothetical protein
MPEPLLYCQAMSAAAVASAATVLLGWAVRRDPGWTWLNIACGLAMGLGLAAGFRVLSWQLAWPPASGLDRMLTIVIPAAIGIELIAGFHSVPRPIAWLLRIGLAAAIPRILLHGSVYLNGADDWNWWQISAAMAFCSATLLGVWSLLVCLSRRSNGGVSVSFALCLSIQSAGAAVIMAGYIKGGAAALPLVAAAAATTIAATLVARQGRKPANFDYAPVLGIGAVGLFGVLFIGRFFGRLSTTCALIMLLAPLLCWVTEAGPLKNRHPWLVGSLRLAFVAIPLVVVLALAKREFDREMSPLLGNASLPSLHFDRSE